MAGNLDKLHEEEIRMILQYVKNKNALYLTCRRLNELCLQIDNKTKDIELIISGTEAVSNMARFIFCYFLISNWLLVEGFCSVHH